MEAVSIRLDVGKLHEIQRNLNPRAEKILDKGARDVEASAKTLAPVDTGALRASLHVEKPEKLVRLVADGVEYGVFQEFGTSHMGAQPFLTPAVEMHRKEIEAAWKELFK